MQRSRESVHDAYKTQLEIENIEWKLKNVQYNRTLSQMVYDSGNGYYYCDTCPGNPKAYGLGEESKHLKSKTHKNHLKEFTKKCDEVITPDLQKQLILLEDRLQCIELKSKIT